MIVTGCLGVEAERIREAHPQVLAITGPQQYEAFVEAMHQALPQQHEPYLDLVPLQGLRLTPRHYAYLKISEGCDHKCRFCIIPQIRGSLRSRPAAAVLLEAERLAKAEVKALLVISQDTSAYGRYIGYAESNWRGSPRAACFFDLAEALGELGIWVRLTLRLPLSACSSGHAADGRRQDPALSRHPLSARQPTGFEGDAPAGQSRACPGSHCRLTPRGSGSHPAIHLHHRLSRRDHGGFPAPARLAGGCADRPPGLLRLRACRGHTGQCPAGPGARRSEGGALASPDGAAAGDLGREAASQSRQHDRGPRSTKPDPRAPSAAVPPMPRRSTARFTCRTPPTSRPAIW